MEQIFAESDPLSEAWSCQVSELTQSRAGGHRVHHVHHGYKPRAGELEGMAYPWPFSIPHHVGGTWASLQGSTLVPKLFSCSLGRMTMTLNKS